MAYTSKIQGSIKDSEFKEELEELIYLTEKIKRYSQIVFTIIFLSIVLFAISTYSNKYLNINKFNFSKFEYQQLQYVDLFFWLINLLVLILGIFFLYRFNILKKRGLLIYDELTDELDWSNKRKEFLRRPPIETRLVIKDFLQNTDLPFTSGSNGQAIYLGFFLILIITTIVLKSV